MFKKWLTHENVQRVIDWYLFKVWTGLLVVIIVFMFGMAIGICYIEEMTTPSTLESFNE